MQKAVITVVGKDATGIIYRVTGVLFQRNANVLDITQTIMQEMFTMIMLIDISMLNISFDQLSEEKKKECKEFYIRLKESCSVGNSYGRGETEEE